MRYEHTVSLMLILFTSLSLVGTQRTSETTAQILVHKRICPRFVINKQVAIISVSDIKFSSVHIFLKGLQNTTKIQTGTIIIQS